MILQVVLQTNTFKFLVNNVNKITKAREWPLITLQRILSPTHIEYEINQSKLKKYLPELSSFLNFVIAFDLVDTFIHVG